MINFRVYPNGHFPTDRRRKLFESCPARRPDCMLARAWFDLWFDEFSSKHRVCWPEEAAASDLEELSEDMFDSFDLPEDVAGQLLSKLKGDDTVVEEVKRAGPEAPEGMPF